MKNLAISALIAAAAISAACSNNGKGNGHEPLLTDTISVADSMVYAGSTAEITISGLYPSGGDQALVDSARLWLADCLSWGTFTGDEPLIHASRQEIANGNSLVEHVSRKLRAAAKRDFIYLASDSIKTGYEYQINFAPDFSSDSLLTYEYVTYCYQGGAHGSAVLRAATFTVPDGRLLTYGNTFRPECRAELIGMIRSALWQQYFLPASGNDGAPTNLGEALLIEPEALDLPICGPQFGEKGITFTYGQYEIAPYSAGMPACTIPYGDLRALMQPRVLSLLPGQNQS